MTNKSDHDRALDDLTRSIIGIARELKEQTPPITIMGPDSSGIPDDTHGADTLICFTMGMRGDLTPRMARSTADQFLAMRKARPKSKIMVVIAGYDEDPRELWDI